MKPSRILSLVVAASALALVGCGESGGPDPKAEQVRVDGAVEMRKLFDKAGGDYAKLDATDKAAFDKLAGGDGAKAFQEMKAGPSATPASGPTP